MIIVNKGKDTEKKFPNTDQDGADCYWDWLAHRYPNEEHIISYSGGSTTRGTSFCLVGCAYCGRFPDELSIPVPDIYESPTV